jgi:exodeoxyribonuclease-3
MKIVTWNVNSIRARQERLLSYLQAKSPDVLCLQELKCLEDKFPALELKALGYEAAVFGQKTYNGVAILAKDPITDVVRGIPDDEEDPQSRVIGGTVRGVRIFSVYAPNGQAVDSPAYQYKLTWYGRLRRYLDAHFKPSDKVVVTGDFNVAPEPIDVHDPVLWEGQTLFSLPERAALTELMGFGLKDLFRQHHPNEEKRFSWWDYRMLGFQKNKGLRIDHVLASAPLAEVCRASDIDREERKGTGASDHAPVWADFDV